MQTTIIKNTLGETNAIIGFDSALKMPYFSWHGFCDLDVIKGACNKLMEIIDETKAFVYLSDNREATGFDAELMNWTGAHFIPKLKDKGIRYHAIVFPEDIFASMSTTEFEKGLEGFFTAKVFSSYDDAIAWVKSLK